MKTNFILTRQNYKLFIHRWNQILDRYGCIFVNGVWTNNMKKSKFYKSIGLSSEFEARYGRQMLPIITHTIGTYFTRHTISHDWDIPTSNDCISICANNGNFFFIQFGQKLRMTNDMIEFRESNFGKYKRDPFKYTCKAMKVTEHESLLAAASYDEERRDYEEMLDSLYDIPERNFQSSKDRDDFDDQWDDLDSIAGPYYGDDILDQ